jgi:hypothetical protein
LDVFNTAQRRTTKFEDSHQHKIFRVQMSHNLSRYAEMKGTPSYPSAGFVCPEQNGRGAIQKLVVVLAHGRQNYFC